MTQREGESGGLELPADAETIRETELRRALRRLDDCGGLTPDQRATVEQLAARLTAELVAMFDADETAEADADADDGQLGASGLAVRENHECL